MHAARPMQASIAIATGAVLLVPGSPTPEGGYRPVGIGEVLDGAIDLPRELPPVVITFDDASPPQLRRIEEQRGATFIDPSGAVGMLVEFERARPGWRNRAVFCMLTAADAGRATSGGDGEDGRHSAWRQPPAR